MLKTHILCPLFSAALIAMSWFGSAHASEQPQTVEEPSLLERYSSSAQDLILKGFELVGINYRFGGTNPDTGLDCSGFVRLSSRKPSACCCRVVPESRARWAQ
jgi:hypothetical protein